jgi:hypothetical protein
VLCGTERHQLGLACLWLLAQQLVLRFGESGWLPPLLWGLLLVVVLDDGGGLTELRVRMTS